MSIRVACKCGKRFNAKEKLAGKTVSCPVCSQPLTIPTPTAPADTVAASAVTAEPIAMVCQCGCRFKAPAKLLGKRVACPGCKSPIDIAETLADLPADPVPEADPFSDLDIPQQAGDPLSAPASHSPTTQSWSTEPSRSKQVNKVKWWLIGGGGLVAAFVIVLLTVGFVRGMVSSRKNDIAEAAWTDFRSEEGGYRVSVLQTPPGISAAELAGKIGEFGIAGLLSQEGPITVVHCLVTEDWIQRSEAEPVLDAMQAEVLEWMFKSAEVLSTGDSSFGIWPAKHMVLERNVSGDRAKIHCRFARTADRVYVLTFVARQDLFIQDQASQFFDSFQLLRAEDNQLVEDLAPLSQLPTRPLALAPPPAPLPVWNGHDLTELAPDTLFGAALEARSHQQIGEMLQLQYWGVANAKTEGLYDLACYYGLNDDPDGAYYWLQEAALLEGVDAGDAYEDPDLNVLRSDQRWRQMSRFLQQCNRYWETQEIFQVEVIVPSGYRNDNPIPVLVGMHGLGDSAQGFMLTDIYETLADEYGFAFVTVSGPKPRGPSSFSWAEDPELDHQQVQKALEFVADRLTVKQDAIVLFGFSQGAAMAASLTATYPSQYAGAIVMSAGTHSDLAPPVSADSGVTQTRGVFVCGAGEHPLTLATTNKWAGWFKQQGAEMKYRAYPGMNEHTFPPDFVEALPKWVKFILD